MPGNVVSYDDVTKTISVALGTQVLDTDEDAPVTRLVEVPELQDVPVCQPSAGGYFIHLPMAAGDPVLVLFCEQDPTAWLETGEANTRPPDLTRHGLFPVAMPGPALVTHEFEELGDRVVVGQVGGPRVSVDPNTIRLGNEDGAYQPAALASEVNDHFAALQNFLDNQIVLGAPTGPTSPGGVVPSPLPPDVGSSVVEIEE